MKAPLALVAAIDAAFNKMLRLDPHAIDRIAALDGKLLALEIRGTGITLYLLATEDRLRISSFASGEADATISATPLGLAQLSFQKDASSAMFAGDVRIRGDVELGQTFKDILGNIQVDWEEQLSHLLGDVAAHQIGRGLRGLFGWGSQSGDSLQENLAEFLQHELQVLPLREDIKHFLNDVDSLRADLERFELKFSRYQATTGTQA